MRFINRKNSNIKNESDITLLNKNMSNTIFFGNLNMAGLIKVLISVIKNSTNEV